MGQDIKYIAIHGNTPMPREVVHFKELDSIIIPIDLYDGEFESLMEDFEEFKTIDELFHYIIEELAPEDSVVESVEVLKALKVDTLVIAGYREILDLPQGYFWIIVKDGQILKNEDRTLDPHKSIGLQTRYMGIVSNEDRYYSFDDGFYEYFENEPDKKLVRRFG